MNQVYDFEKVGVCSDCGRFGDCGVYCITCSPSTNIFFSYRKTDQGQYCVIGEHNCPYYEDKASFLTQFLFRVAQTDPTITIDYDYWVTEIQYMLLNINITDLDILKSNLVNLNEIFAKMGMEQLNENTIGVMMFIFATSEHRST